MTGLSWSLRAASPGRSRVLPTRPRPSREARRVHRVGLDRVRAEIVDDTDKRRSYRDRFVYSQTFAQIDPWSERVQGKEAHEFQAMAELSYPAAAE